MKKVIINNMPAYARTERFIVATRVDGALWFWGAYSTLESACRAIDCREDREVYEVREVA